MQWRTEVPVTRSSHLISHRDKIILVGSCFSEYIGSLLEANKFKILRNPYGILYNPVSIAQSLEEIIGDRPYSSEELVQRDGLWHSMSHHGCFSGVDKDEVTDRINSSRLQSRSFLKDSKFLIITWGSSFIYRYNETGQIAGNCHKIPASAFTKELLSAEDIIDKYLSLYRLLQNFNAGIRVIFTISPVRHWRDGAENNQVSKAILLLAKHKLLENIDAEYFPSYEIVMDELRDYRFYTEDLIHPNSLASKYIFEKFGHAYFSENTREINSAIYKIAASAQHRPINDNTLEHKQFCKRMSMEAQKLQDKYKIDLSKEISHFNKYV